MPKIVDHAAQRDSLVDGAFEFFADSGYAALSMRGLASRLGVTTGVLYHYFDTKNAIFEQSLLRSTERHIRAALEAVDLSAPIPERELSLASWVVEHQDDLKRTLLLALDAQRQAPDAQAVITQAVQRFADSLEEHIGVARTAWPKLLGALVATQLSGEPLTRSDLSALLAG
jgi:AcrR family transcriptional regulator